MTFLIQRLPSVINTSGQALLEPMARLGSHPPGDGTTVVNVIDTTVFDIKLTATWRGDYEHDSDTQAASLGVASFSPARSEHQEHFLQFLHEVVDTVTGGHVLLGEDGRTAIFESKPREPPPWKLNLRLLSGDQPYFRALETKFADCLWYTSQQAPTNALNPFTNHSLTPNLDSHPGLSPDTHPNPNLSSGPNLDFNPDPDPTPTPNPCLHLNLSLVHSHNSNPHSPPCLALNPHLDLIPTLNSDPTPTLSFNLVSTPVYHPCLTSNRDPAASPMTNLNPNPPLTHGPLKGSPYEFSFHWSNVTDIENRDSKLTFVVRVPFGTSIDLETLITDVNHRLPPGVPAVLGISGLSISDKFASVLQTGDASTPFWTVTGGKAITHDDQLAGTGARTYRASDDVYFSAPKHRIVDLVGANVDILMPHYAFTTSTHPNRPHAVLFHAKIELLGQWMCKRGLRRSHFPESPVVGAVGPDREGAFVGDVEFGQCPLCVPIPTEQWGLCCLPACPNPACMERAPCPKSDNRDRFVEWQNSHECNPFLPEGYLKPRPPTPPPTPTKKAKVGAVNKSLTTGSAGKPLVSYLRAAAAAQAQHQQEARQRFSASAGRGRGKGKGKPSGSSAPTAAGPYHNSCPPPNPTLDPKPDSAPTSNPGPFPYPDPNCHSNHCPTPSPTPTPNPNLDPYPDQGTSPNPGPESSTQLTSNPGPNPSLNPNLNPDSNPHPHSSPDPDLITTSSPTFGPDPNPGPIPSSGPNPDPTPYPCLNPNPDPYLHPNPDPPPAPLPDPDPCPGPNPNTNHDPPSTLDPNPSPTSNPTLPPSLLLTPSTSCTTHPFSVPSSAQAETCALVPLAPSSQDFDQCPALLLLLAPAHLGSLGYFPVAFSPMPGLYISAVTIINHLAPALCWPLPHAGPCMQCLLFATTARSRFPICAQVRRPQPQ